MLDWRMVTDPFLFPNDFLFSIHAIAYNVALIKGFFHSINGRNSVGGFAPTVYLTE